MLSQLGCVTLAPETIEAVYRGETLTPDEEAQYEAHPSVAYALLSKIPRLEPIAWMIEQQNRRAPAADDSKVPDMRLGAEILRLVLTYEQLIHKGASRNEAAHTLAMQNKNFSPEFVRTLVTLDPNAEEGETRKCQIEDLLPGMIIQEEVHTLAGALVVSKGQEVTPAVIFKLKNLLARQVLSNNVSASMPRSTLAFVKGASQVGTRKAGVIPEELSRA
jgi:hypothetical protein